MVNGMKGSVAELSPQPFLVKRLRLRRFEMASLRRVNLTVVTVILLFASLPVTAGQESVFKGLRGAVSDLPDGILSLPTSKPVSITLNLPTDRIHSSLPVVLDILPSTAIRLLVPLLQDGDLVEVDASLLDQRIVADDVGEAPLGRYVGVAASVPGEALALPAESSQVFSLEIEGLGNLPIVITPVTRAEGPHNELRQGDDVEVDVVISAGEFVAVRIRSE
jgi:hypothetical protein